MLLVELDASVVVPLLACQLLEDVELQLASAGLWQLATLGQIEGKGQELLSVTGVHINALNCSLVLQETLLHLLN